MAEMQELRRSVADDDAYIKEIRAKRQTKEVEYNKEVKFTALALIVAMLVIVGIFAFSLFGSMKEPAPIAVTAAPALANDSPTPAPVFTLDSSATPQATPDAASTDTATETTPTAIDTATDVPVAAAVDTPIAAPPETPMDTPVDNAAEVSNSSDGSEEGPIDETGDLPPPDDTEATDLSPPPAAALAISATSLLKTSSPGPESAGSGEMPKLAMPKLDFSNVAQISGPPRTYYASGARRSMTGRHPSSTTGSAEPVATESPTSEPTTGSGITGPKTSIIIVYCTKTEFEGTQGILFDNRSNERKGLDFVKFGDGKYRVEVPPGNYTLRLVKSGFEPFDTGLLLGAGKKAEIYEPLKKKDTFSAFLEVQSEPKGANVYLDDDLKGSTPCIIRGLATKRYSIFITMQGYQPLRSTVKFVEGEGQKKMFYLKEIEVHRKRGEKGDLEAP